MTFKILPRAERELQEILRGRAEAAGVGAAQKLDDRVHRLIELVGERGAPGAVREDLADARYRFAPLKPYWIIWRDGETPNERLIVKIIDARRALAEILRDFMD